MRKSSTAGFRRRVLRRTVLAVVGVVALGAATTTASVAYVRSAGTEVSSIALTSKPQPNVRDDAFDISRLGGWGLPGLSHASVDADASATANSECDGCDATATTLSIVYLDGARTGNFDNVAAAWNKECTQGCASTSVSVQVVIGSSRLVKKVSANNRALSLNLLCSGCRASSEAFQLVMLTPKGKTLSWRDVRDLRNFINSRVAALSAPATPSLRAAPQASTDAALEQLESQGASALGGATTLESNADVQRS